MIGESGSAKLSFGLGAKLSKVRMNVESDLTDWPGAGGTSLSTSGLLLARLHTVLGCLNGFHLLVARRLVLAGVVAQLGTAPSDRGQLDQHECPFAPDDRH